MTTRYLIVGKQRAAQERAAADLAARLRPERDAIVSGRRFVEAARPFGGERALLAYARAHRVLVGAHFQGSEDLLAGLSETQTIDLASNATDPSLQILLDGEPGAHQGAGGVGTAQSPGPLAVLVRRCSACGAEKASLPERNNSSGGWLRRFRARPSGLKSLYRRLMTRRFLGQPRPDAESTPSDLAVVACFFDPCESTKRRENLLRFHEAMAATGVPLLTVIGEFPEATRIADPEYGDALRIPCVSVLWQKERLLNHGIRVLLDRGFEKIAWVDADVVPERPRAWASDLSEALDRHPLVQAFSFMKRLEASGPPELGLSAIGYLARTGKLSSQERIYAGRSGLFGLPRGLSGYAWAVRADVLRRQLLYERAVVGGADKMMYVASCARGEDLERRVRILTEAKSARCEQCGHRSESTAYADDFLHWARRWKEALAQSMARTPGESEVVGEIDHVLSTLSHGVPARRRYLSRREVLLHFGYDPQLDVVADEGGGLRWTPRHPGMHHAVLNYFFERQEDRAS